MSTQPNTQVNRQVSAYRAPRMPRLKAGLLALVLAGSLISPAHATGVPTVDGSAILTNLQQWLQSAQRWYSQMQSMQPGEFAQSMLGQEQATNQADSYIAALEKAKQQMQESSTCQKYPVQASKMLCVEELDLKVRKMDAYITLLNGVKDDYNALAQKVKERQSVAAQFSAGDQMTGGGNTQQEKLRVLDAQIADLRERISTNMQQHKGQIDMIDGQLNMVHGIRVDVARVQFEGNAGGLSDLIKKGAVTATLETATQEYKDKADAAKTSTIRYNNGHTKTGTNY